MEQKLPETNWEANNMVVEAKGIYTIIAYTKAYTILQKAAKALMK